MNKAVNREKAVDKIRKILELGNVDKNNSESEVQAALLKAQRLMMKYGLEESDIDVKDLVKEVVDEGFKNVTSYNMLLVILLCKHFKVTPMKGSSIRFVGLKEDVAVCKEMTTFTLNVFSKLAAKYIKKWKSENPNAPVSRAMSAKVKGDYAAGFIKGLEEKFKKQEEEFSLVVIQDEAVTDYVKKKTGGSKGVGMGRLGDMAAYTEGFKDGKSLVKDTMIEN